MKTTATQEYCMDTLYTQPYWNWVRNVENTSTLCTYFFQYSTAYCAKILMTPTVTQNNYVETSPAECYWNWMRNVEYMSKYLFTNMSEAQQLMKTF